MPFRASRFGGEHLNKRRKVGWVAALLTASALGFALNACGSDSSSSGGGGSGGKIDGGIGGTGGKTDGGIGGSGGGGTGGAGGSAGAGGSGGVAGSGGTAGSGGVAGAAGAGGTGGAQGGGKPGMDMMSGGNVMKSASYTLILSTGQGPGGNGVMKSTNYHLNGGLVGATQ